MSGYAEGQNSSYWVKTEDTQKAWEAKELRRIKNREEKQEVDNIFR